MMKTVCKLEIYKLIRHPMTSGILILLMGLLSLLFYRLCVDYLHLAHSSLHSRGVQASLSVEVIKPLCSWTIFLMALFLPLLTVQSYSQEFKQKTFYFWAMSSRSASSIVLGKWLSLMMIIALIPLTLLFMISTLSWNAILNWQLIGFSLMTVTLVGACIISFGLFISCLFAHPLLALALTYIGEIIWMLLEWLNPFPSHLSFLAKEFSLINHSYYALNGIVYSPDIVFYGLACLFWITLTIRQLNIKLIRNLT